MTVSDGFSPSPKGEGMGEPARPLSKSATAYNAASFSKFLISGSATATDSVKSTQIRDIVVVAKHSGIDLHVS